MTLLASMHTEQLRLETQVEDLGEQIQYQYQMAYDHHLDTIDELTDDLKLCDQSGEESSLVVVTDEDDAKTAELKKRFAEEKEKYDEMKRELIKSVLDSH